MPLPIITANQYPEKENRIRQLARRIASVAPALGLVSRPARPQGISVMMRVKNEEDWINLNSLD